jgi:hypothetical protein
MSRLSLLAYYGFAALIWLVIESLYSFWLSVLITTPLWASDREMLRQAFKRYPEIVGEVARCDVESREARRRRMVQHSYASSAPRGH